MEKKTEITICSNEYINKQEKFRANTIGQYKILQFIKENFEESFIDAMKCEVLNDNFLKISDAKDSIIFGYNEKDREVINIDEKKFNNLMEEFIRQDVQEQEYEGEEPELD